MWRCNQKLDLANLSRNCTAEALTVFRNRLTLFRGHAIQWWPCQWCSPAVQGTASDTALLYCKLGNAPVGSLEMHLKAFALVNGGMDISQVELVMESMSSSSRPCSDLQNSAFLPQLPFMRCRLSRNASLVQPL